MLLSFVGAFTGAVLATWLVRSAMRRWRVLDVPNSRSAHSVPTPTLGGIGIIAGFWAGWWLTPGAMEGTVGLLCISAVLSLAILDDLKRPFKVWEKLLLQAAVVAVCIHFGFVFESVTLPLVGKVGLGAVGVPLTALWILALSNIYNFMDGIDGLTGTESVAVCLLAVAALSGAPAQPVKALLALCGAAVGFLVLNRPPATIFMGDVGSLFLGTVLSVAAIWGEAEGLPIWLFCLFLGYYFFDTLYTLARRLWRGDDITVAHRLHLYQRLHTLGWSPWKINAWVLLTTAALGGGGLGLHSGPSLGGGLALMAGVGALLWTTIWVERRMPDFWAKENA